GRLDEQLGRRADADTQADRAFTAHGRCLRQTRPGTPRRPTLRGMLASPALERKAARLGPGEHTRAVKPRKATTEAAGGRRSKAHEPTYRICMRGGLTTKLTGPPPQPAENAPARAGGSGAAGGWATSEASMPPAHLGKVECPWYGVFLSERE